MYIFFFLSNGKRNIFFGVPEFNNQNFNNQFVCSVGWKKLKNSLLRIFKKFDLIYCYVKFKSGENKNENGREKKGKNWQFPVTNPCANFLIIYLSRIFHTTSSRVLKKNFHLFLTPSYKSIDRNSLVQESLKLSLSYATIEYIYFTLPRERKNVFILI